MTTLVATLRYYAKSTIENTILVGISAVAMVLSRIPNIIGLLPLLFIIIYKQRKLSKILTDCTIGLCSFLLTGTILILIMYGNFSDYIAVWNSDNIITGHTDIFIYINMLIGTIPICGVMGLPIITSIILGFIMSRWQTQRRTIFFVSVALVVIATYISFLTYLTQLNSYPYVAYLFVFSYGFVYNHTHNTQLRYSHSTLWISAIFAIIPAIGSDVMVLKLLIVPILPIAISILYSHFRKTLFPTQVFKLFAISTILIFALVRMFAIKNQSNPFPQYPQLSGISGSDYMVEVVDNLKTICDDKYSIAYIGNAKYIYDYLLTNESGYNLHLFHYKLSASEIKHDITEKITDYDIVKLTLYYDESITNAEHIRLYDKYLQEYGYEKISSDKLIYIKKGISHNSILL